VKAMMLLSAAVILTAQTSNAGRDGLLKQGAAQTVLDGHVTYLAHCGICHLEGGTGTFMLARRLGKQRALLAEHTDLTPAYVEAIVRNGLNSMPAITRVEITDQELAAVADYLAHHRENAPASHHP
jgi:mono/diheme cytochrome c family protein